MTFHTDEFEFKNAETGSPSNKDQIEGKWNELKRKAKEKFGKLNNDDLLKAEYSIDLMVGVLQSRYGYTKEQAQKEWNKFMDDYDQSFSSLASETNQASDKAKSELADSAASVVGSAKEIASQALTQGKQVVNETFSDVASKADTLVSEQKQQAVRKLEGVSGALRSSSDQLRQDDQGTFADYADIVANYVDEFSTFLRNRTECVKKRETKKNGN